MPSWVDHSSRWGGTRQLFSQACCFSWMETKIYFVVFSVRHDVKGYHFWEWFERLLYNCPLFDVFCEQQDANGFRNLRMVLMACSAIGMMRKGTTFLRKVPMAFPRGYTTKNNDWVLRRPGRIMPLLECRCSSDLATKTEECVLLTGPLILPLLEHRVPFSFFSRPFDPLFLLVLESVVMSLPFALV